MNKDKNIKGYIISEDVISSTPKILNDGDITSFETVLQEGDVPNRNKRIYPTDVIKRALSSDYIQERLRTKSWVGECGHPLQPTVERQLYLDQSRLSHIITKIWWEDNLLKGVVECANTASGRDMQGLIRQGMQAAFSMRGFGPASTKKGDITEIQHPLYILTYDWVIHPSHKPAYMTKMLTESSSPLMSESGSPYFIPLQEDSIVSFINDESVNVKNLKKNFDMDNASTLGYDKKNKLVYFEEGYNILAAYVEDYISNDIDRYLANL